MVRAAKYGMGLELAIIGGAPQRFAPLVQLFHKETEQNGFEPRRIAVHSHGYIADTDEQAMEEYYPYWHHSTGKLGAERGWPAPTPEQFAQEVRHGALHLGSPETVARKIANTVTTLGATRFGMKYGNGRLPHELMMHSIELYGTKVMPMVRDMLSSIRTMHRVHRGAVEFSATKSVERDRHDQAMRDAARTVSDSSNAI